MKLEGCRCGQPDIVMPKRCRTVDSSTALRSAGDLETLEMELQAVQEEMRSLKLENANRADSLRAQIREYQRQLEVRSSHSRCLGSVGARKRTGGEW